MNESDSARSVREEAQALALRVGAGRAVLAIGGERDKTLDDAAQRLTDVLMRAGTVEAREHQALTATMEQLDPEEFKRERRLRLARGRMAALRQKKGGQR